MRLSSLSQTGEKIDRRVFPLSIEPAQIRSLDAFSKLKALRRKAAARTIDDLWQVIADAASRLNTRRMQQLLRRHRI